MPVRRSPGLLEVPRAAVSGGRTFRPWNTLYHFTPRGVRPDATALVLEDQLLWLLVATQRSALGLHPST